VVKDTAIESSRQAIQFFIGQAKVVLIFSPVCLTAIRMTWLLQVVNQAKDQGL
jgi:hypothetical protein